MIDQSLRLRGIGASEIAAVVGIDPRRSAFDVWAEKTGLVARTEPTARMRWGKKLERVIAEAYSEETGHPAMWRDQTLPGLASEVQIFTPDAYVFPVGAGPLTNAIGGLDCKNVAFDQWEKWGEVGTDAVPDSIALQCQWSCSASGLPWWDVAALFGGNDLRIYRVHIDVEIVGVLIDQGEKFWRDHVLTGNAPEIQNTSAAREYLRQRYPASVEALRPATDEERALITDYRTATRIAGEWQDKADALKLRICDHIGEAEGVTFDAGEPGKAGRVTWKLGKEVLVKEHVRAASRRFDCRVVKA